MGCDNYPGYLFSRPLPIGQVKAFVQRVPTFATVSVPYYKLITIFACLPVTMIPKEY